MNSTSIEIVFRELNQAGVRYLVVGGLAVVAHGHVRFTADVDLLLDMREENLKAAMSIFDALGYRPRAPVELAEFCDKEKRATWREEKGLTVFSLWSERFPMTEIDLFLESPFPSVEPIFDRAVSLEIAPGTSAVVIGVKDLLEMKRAVGRPQDIDDVRALEMIGEDGE